MTKITGKIKGVFTQAGLDAYAKKIHQAKLNAYKKSMPIAVKNTKVSLATNARNTFKVKSKTFNGLFTAKIYNTKPDKMPSVLFLTRSTYFGIFEKGGVITSKKGRGLLIPFVNLNNRGQDLANGILGKKGKFKETLAKLQKEGKTFWKQVNGKLILFAKIDKDNRKSLGAFKKQYSKTSGVSRVKSGTAIPIGIFVKNTKITKRFKFRSIAENSFSPYLVSEFQKNLRL